MQAIVNALGEQAQVAESIFIDVINTLFEVDYSLPDVVKEKRPSLAAFNLIKEWGGTTENALSASLLTLNTKHGPFSETYELISRMTRYPVAEVHNRREIIRGYKIVPGFGNVVYKNIDDRCKKIEECLSKYTSVYTDISNLVTSFLKETRDITLFSNLAFWNVAAMHFCGLSQHHSSLVFILATQIKHINLWHSLQPQ